MPADGQVNSTGRKNALALMLMLLHLIVPRRTSSRPTARPARCRSAFQGALLGVDAAI